MSEERNWKDILLGEMKKLSITTIYLWVLLSVFVLHRSIVLAEYNIRYSEQLGFALINSLILAKFILIAEALHAGKKAENKPLWYSILFKSILFSAILMVCHILEEALVKMWHGSSFTQSLPEISGRTLREVLAGIVITFVVLIPFFTAKELIRVIGFSEVKSLLLKGRTNNSHP